MKHPTTMTVSFLILLLIADLLRNLNNLVILSSFS